MVYLALNLSFLTYKWLTLNFLTLLSNSFIIVLFLTGWFIQAYLHLFFVPFSLWYLFTHLIPTLILKSKLSSKHPDEVVASFGSSLIGISFALIFILFDLLPYFFLICIFYLLVLLGLLVYIYREYHLWMAPHYTVGFWVYLEHYYWRFYFSLLNYPATHYWLAYYYSIVLSFSLNSLELVPLWFSYLEFSPKAYCAPLPVPPHAVIPDNDPLLTADDPRLVEYLLNLRLRPLPVIELRDTFNIIVTDPNDTNTRSIIDSLPCKAPCNLGWFSDQVNLSGPRLFIPAESYKYVPLPTPFPTIKYFPDISSFAHLSLSNPWYLKMLIEDQTTYKDKYYPTPSCHAFAENFPRYLLPSLSYLNPIIKLVDVPIRNFNSVDISHYPLAEASWTETHRLITAATGLPLPLTETQSRLITTDSFTRFIILNPYSIITKSASGSALSIVEALGNDYANRKPSIYTGWLWYFKYNSPPSHMWNDRILSRDVVVYTRDTQFERIHFTYERPYRPNHGW